MRSLRIFLGAVILSTLVVAPVKADWTQLFGGVYTGGSNFETTASIALSYELESAGVYLFKLDVTNLGTNGEFLKSVGLFNVDVPPLIVEGVSAPSGWSYQPPENLTGDGLLPESFQYNAPKPVPQGDTDYGYSGSFVFRVSGFSDTYALEDANVGGGIHSIGFDECSTKLGVLDGVVVREGPYDPTCVAVPEPATGFLVGAGLLGLFGVALRRRKEDEVIED